MFLGGVILPALLGDEEEVARSSIGADIAGRIHLLFLLLLLDFINGFLICLCDNEEGFGGSCFCSDKDNGGVVVGDTFISTIGDGILVGEQDRSDSGVADRQSLIHSSGVISVDEVLPAEVVAGASFKCG